MNKLFNLPSESRFSSDTVGEYILRLCHEGKIETIDDGAGLRIRDHVLRDQVEKRRTIGEARLAEIRTT